MKAVIGTLLAVAAAVGVSAVPVEQRQTTDYDYIVSILAVSNRSDADTHQGRGIGRWRRTSRVKTRAGRAVCAAD